MSCFFPPIINIIESTLLLPGELFSSFRPTLQNAFEDRLGRQSDLITIFQKALQVVHAAHFITRRVERLIRIGKDHISLYVGATLQLLDNAFVKTAVKILIVVERILKITEAIQKFAASLSRVVNELYNNYPFPLDHIKYHLKQYEGPFELDLITELALYVDETIGEILLRSARIVEQTVDVVQDLFMLSRACFDLYDTLSCTNQELEYYEVTQVVEKIARFVEEQPGALLNLLRREEVSFKHACSLLKLDPEQTFNYFLTGIELARTGTQIVRTGGQNLLTASNDITSLLKIVA